MTVPMPFVYPGEIISLLLLWIILSLIRQSAVTHLTLEFRRLEKELLLFCAKTGVDAGGEIWISLRNRIQTACRLAPKMSPARYWFAYRVCKRAKAPSDPVSRIEMPGKVAYFRLEIFSRLGVFLMWGSISGWILFVFLFCRICVRLFSRPCKNRGDRFVDLFERVLLRLGRRTYEVAVLAD